MEVKTEAILKHFNISTNATFSKVYDLIYDKAYEYTKIKNYHNPIYSISKGLVVELYDLKTKSLILKYQLDYCRIEGEATRFTLNYLIEGVELKEDILFKN